MFLKQLYKNNKPIFILVVAFSLIQLFINFKRGMVAAPFFHYGMYSAVLDPKPTYYVWEIWINGKQLKEEKFNPWQRDLILQPVKYYSSINASNQLYHTNIQRLFNRVHLNPNSSKFLSNCNYPIFEKWYQAYLSKHISQPINQLSIVQREYTYFNGRLRLTQNIKLLRDLCP